jgi:uncharacterized cupredoxin-like copper-binding protein
MRKPVRAALLVTLVGLVAVGLSASALGGSRTSAQTSQRISVGMTEYKFTLKPKTATKRTVVFALKNNGTIGHDFKIAGKKSRVLAAGKSGTLRVTFKKAGRFAFLCTLPTHAPAGMKGVLIVK